MKRIFKNYLFSHNILVSDSENKADEAFAALFLLLDEYGIKIDSGAELATKEMVEIVSYNLNKDVPDPFYRGFPDSVRELSEDELAFDQCMHYMRTYGMGDFSTAGHSMLERVTKRKEFSEETQPKHFTIVTESEAIMHLVGYVEYILKGTRPLSDTMYQMVLEFIKDYNFDVRECASKNTAIRLLCELRDVRFASFLIMSDIIKVVDEINYTVYGNKHINKLHMRNKDRKFITEIINICALAGKIDTTTCYEQKKNWAGLLHHIHYKPVNTSAREFCAKMRGSENHSTYSVFEKAIEFGRIKFAVDTLVKAKGSGAVLRNLDYLVSNCSSDAEVDSVFDAIGTENKIVLIQNLINQHNKLGHRDYAPRTFKFTKHNKLIVHTETDDEQRRRCTVLTRRKREKIINSINKKLVSAYRNKLGRVYIDKDMDNIALPIQETTSSGGYGLLPKGSRIHIPEGKKIRAFTYWEKVDDIDLSCFGFTKDGKRIEFSWRTMYEKQSDAITYSGDETSGYNGGSEYFDIDIEKFREMYPEVEYIIFCDNVYSWSTFNKCFCKAGYMMRDTEDSGEIYEPKTVKSSFLVDADSTFAYLFAIDIKARDFVWLNITRDSQAHVAGLTEMDFLRQYMNVTDVMNVGKLFSMMACSIVDDPDKADVVVSDNYNGDNVIHSYDYEKIMALMN